MRLIPIAYLLLILSSVARAEVIRLSEPVEIDNQGETFGKTLNLTLPETTISDLLKAPNKVLNKPFLLKTNVAKVCQKKGCFFIARQQQNIIRVSFLDYGFFLPTDSGEKDVILNGTLIQKEMKQKQLAHFNQDLKTEDSGLNSGKVYEIVASAVKVLN